MPLECVQRAHGSVEPSRIHTVVASTQLRRTFGSFKEQGGGQELWPRRDSFECGGHVRVGGRFWRKSSSRMVMVARYWVQVSTS